MSKGEVIIWRCIGDEGLFGGLKSPMGISSIRLFCIGADLEGRNCSQVVKEEKRFVVVGLMLLLIDLDLLCTLGLVFIRSLSQFVFLVVVCAMV